MRQFVSWTVMSAPKSPHMWMVIEDIINAVHKKTEEHHIPISSLTKDIVGDVVDFIGSRRLTISVLKSLELTFNETIDQNSIHNLLDPKLVGDVLILPGYSFAASSNRYGTNQNLTGPSLVTHHYAGSWKNQNGGKMRRSTFRFRWWIPIPQISPLIRRGESPFVTQLAFCCQMDQGVKTQGSFETKALASLWLDQSVWYKTSVWSSWLSNRKI